MKKCYKILLGLLAVVVLIGCSHGEELEEGVFSEAVEEAAELEKIAEEVSEEISETDTEEKLESQ